MPKDNKINLIKISHVVINIGVGQSGEPLEKAKTIIEEICGQKPVQTYAKKAIRELGIHQGAPIGVKTTLRKQLATDVLKKLLIAKSNKISRKSFDATGNLSFGIQEHIEIPGTKYNPEFGIWGMDVSVALERMGYRVKKRKVMTSVVGKRQQVTPEDAINFAQTEFGVEIED